ncbi:MAG: histidine phosphatase family protein [Gaiellaceae bacterium]
MTTILLARHGETDWNFERRVQGHADRPLNDTGRAQAHALADGLDGETIDAIYSSDLVRAHETARIVAALKGLEVTAVPGLREKHFGTWEGLTEEEVLARFPEARRGRWGDGETSEEMSRRVLETLRRIAESHPDGRVLVVTHGGPLRAVLLHCTSDHEGPIGNCQVVRIAVEEGAIRPVD